MRIYSAAQQRYLDQVTIQKEPISSHALMERAASACFTHLLKHIRPDQEVILFCGTGNNGGDGLVLSRLFKEAGFLTSTYLVGFGEMTEDCQLQFERVKQDLIIFAESSRPLFHSNAVVIDALLGTGSNRKPEELLAAAINSINNSGVPIYSIDMPSGLPADEVPDHHIVVKANKTFTIHAPKLTFFLPETYQFVGEWEVVDIGINELESKKIQVRFEVMESDQVKELIPLRERFSHKGTYGHGLLIAGSSGKMGACVLSARAALRSGLGFLSVYTCQEGKSILPTAIPESMGIFDVGATEITDCLLPTNLTFDAIAIGPGLGIHPGTGRAIERVFNINKPTVVDADALNMLGMYPDLLEELPVNSILTPHPKEFERLAGKSENSSDRLERLIHFAQTYRCVVVLKDAITAIATPGGKVWLNTTGNNGMAKGGSGDTLTGILLGLLAQGICPENAAKIGVFFHGIAGDKAVEKRGERAILASDLIEELRIG
jgi:NAD(P)H-hydrate epimerase